MRLCGTVKTGACVTVFKDAVWRRPKRIFVCNCTSDLLSVPTWAHFGASRGVLTWVTLWADLFQRWLLKVA